MTVFDICVGPDYFERIRLGMLSKLIFPYKLGSRPVEGDQLRIECALNRQVINEILVDIIMVSKVSAEINGKHMVEITVLPNKPLIFVP
ncbi:hypothetical protein ACF3VQ_01960 [Yersinia sp. HM-2024]|uniref:hypothetical protein n=1 Tax=Yersinia sp. HM-2024 TaxID=3344550 RepID=UPI00370D211C